MSEEDIDCMLRLEQVHKISPIVCDWLLHIITHILIPFDRETKRTNKKMTMMKKIKG